ncbi:nickel ABC transporter permease subunit NikB [Spirochaetia bacterium]|nr:nickel ABC transporter permease subunit NikB [Spirochaetia bacterium]
MGKFIVKRIVTLIPLLFTVSIVVFLLLHSGPNDPAMSYLRLSNIPPTAAALEEVRERFGLNRPLLTQYIDWLGKALHGDFGISFVTGVSVTKQLFYYLPNTLYLASVSLLITLLLSIPLGITAAHHHDSWPDHLCRIFAYIGVSTPGFWLAFLMIILFSLRLHWLPTLGIGGFTYVIMPAFSTALMSAAVNTRLIRGNMLEQMHTRHVLYARLRGVREPLIIGSHVLKNSFIPVVTALGMHIGEILGGAVVAEVIFAWPGVGRYAVSAIYNRDFPVMQCFILLMTFIFVICNLLTDILYAALDPRIRLSEGGTGNV